MAKCQHCGKEVDIPYKCKYCGGLFCEEHRLPPNHNCPNIQLWKSKKPPSSSSARVLRKEGIILRPTSEIYVKRRRKIGKKTLLIVVLLILGGLVYYAHASGYYNLSLLKKQVLSIPFALNSSKVESSKIKSKLEETYLKTYPVKVWYDVASKELKYWWGGKEKVRVVCLYFKNEGSERVSFMIDPTKVYIVGEKGDNEYIGYVNVSNNKVVLHPNELKNVEIYFYDLPERGWMYITIDYVGVIKVHLGNNMTYSDWDEFKGFETIKLYFKLP